MKNLFLIFSFICTSFLYSQQIELKKWIFYSDKDTVKQQVTIPHTWNAQDAFDDEPGYWQGKGYYLKQIAVDDLSKAYFLHFNGANQVSKVWVNNQFAGEHKGGYTAFDVDITKLIVKGLNSLKVVVDNSYDETIPPLDADFTFYGGIYRKVYLIAENQKHFAKKYGADNLKIDALITDDFNGKLSITGGIFNKNNKKYTVKIKVLNTDFEQVLKKITEGFNVEIAIKKPLLWSPDEPNLYTVQVQLYHKNKLLDAYEHKVGFRKFEATTKGFMLNGKPLKLIGVNRHQDWEGLGNAVPIKRQLEDMTMIKQMGANFLRLAHYPQDKAIYNAADSLGIILWSEIPIVNKVPSTSDYLEFKKNSLQMQQEHIAQNYTHPSLVFIGYMNEIFLRMVFDKPDEKTEEKIINNTLELAKELEELTRAEAPYHLTVMALHGNQIYNKTGIADLPMVIGWNLYYGWYGGEIYELGGFLDEEFLRYPHRPLIISEYGVGADVRLHNDDPKRFDFSEEYQFKYHPGYYEQVINRDFVIGMSAWNFADFGSEFRGDAMPHINQKGLVNFNRTPKNIYYWYKATLQPKEKMSRFFNDFQEHISDVSSKRIMIISNQNVLLKDNYGYGTVLTPHNNLVNYYANLFEGKNKFELYNETGQLVDSLALNYKKPSLNELNQLAINFGSESYFKDSTDITWVPLKEVVSIVTIDGDYKIKKSSTNIENTVNDPLYQSSVYNINELIIKVPKGEYQIMLLFSKLVKENKLAYELDKKNTSTITSTADILTVNDVLLTIGNIEPFHRKEITVKIIIKDSIVIKATDEKLFSMCGIKIKRL